MIIDQLDVGIATFDAALRCQQVNRWAADRAARSPAVLVGGHAADVTRALVGEATGGPMAAACRDVLATGEIVRGSAAPAVLRRDDAPDPGAPVPGAPVPGAPVPGAPCDAAVDVWLDWSVRRHTDSSGAPLGVVLLYHDVSAHVRRARAEVAGSQVAIARAAADRAWLGGALRDAPVGVILADAPSGQLRYTNTEMDRLAVGGAPRVASKSDYAQWVAFHPDGRPLALADYPLVRVLTTGQAVGAEEYRFQRGDGSFVWVRTRAAPVVGPDGALLGGIVIVVDIDAERAAVAERERLRAAAEAHARERDEVLAIVSHDLRAPLSAIAMSARALAESPRADRAEVAGAITQSSAWALRIIRDLVDVNAIEGGRLAVHPEPMTVQAILDAVTAMFDGPARARGVTLAVARRRPPRWIEADVDRVVQAVGNLVTNALTFTPAGGRVSLTVSGDGAGAVRFAVADTGPGIAPEHLPHVFDRFWQAQPSRRGGTGLGLAIARGIAEGHGGRIDVASTPGQGSTFTLVLPAAH